MQDLIIIIFSIIVLTIFLEIDFLLTFITIKKIIKLINFKCQIS